jgi:hypothetical protein
VEVALLGQVGRPPGRRLVGVAGSGAVAGQLQQVRADCVEPVVAGDPVVGLERAEQVQPGLGPLAMATATAWFSATTGVSETRRSSSYRATICGQSVASALGASSWTAAMAAWSW